MWGTPLRDAQLGREVRFIPTHVGNAIGILASDASIAVHPHACGERVPCPEPRIW